MKNSKISKEYSAAVCRRRTDNTMANRKRTKGQTTIYKTQHRNLEIDQHVPNWVKESVKLL